MRALFLCAMFLSSYTAEYRTTARFQLVANPAIKKLEDFRGKNIGTPGIQTASSEAVEMILKRGAGLLPGKDFNYVSTGGADTNPGTITSPSGPNTYVEFVTCEEVAS